VEDERDPLGGRQLVEQHQQRRPDGFGYVHVVFGLLGDVRDRLGKVCARGSLA
jgi:hypothetical protein